MEPQPFRIWSDTTNRYEYFTFDNILVSRDLGKKAFRCILVDDGWAYFEQPITGNSDLRIEQFTGQYTGSGEPIYVDFPKN